jgi:hypothetical protein
MRHEIAFTKNEKSEMIGSLDELLEKAKMSPALVKAVKSTKKALSEDRTCLAEELTSVKSLVSGGYVEGEIDDSGYPFSEDSKYNESVLNGKNAYRILDGMHFDLSMKIGRMPSGRVVITGGGIRTRENEPKKDICAPERPLINRNASIKLIRREFKSTWERKI